MEKDIHTFSLRNEEVRMYGEYEWRQVKRLRKKGCRYTEIGRELNINRKTVKKLSLMRNPPRRGKRREKGSKLDKFKIYIDLWLKDKVTLRATIIQARIEKLGWEGSYSTVKRYVREKKDKFSREATVRFETLPGEQAQVDFGEVKVRYLDGRKESVNIYLLTLGFSRKKDSDISDYKNRKALMYLMERSFWRLGGVPREVLFDNLKPVAKRPRTFASEGEISDEWKWFEGYYGFKTKLSMVYRAQTKGKVERPIEPIKRFIESNIFLNKEHLREELRKEIERCNRREHSTTKQSPDERFKQELDFIQPLPLKPFDFARIEIRRVTKDCLISVEGVRYSVPWEYVGQRLEVRITGTEIQVFSGKGTLISCYRKLSSEERERYNFVIQKTHYEGLSGYERAFLNFEKLNKMGFGPFLVVKQDLKDCKLEESLCEVEKRALKFYEKVSR